MALRQDYKRAAFKQASALAALGFGGRRVYLKARPGYATTSAGRRRHKKKKPRKFVKSNAKLSTQMTSVRKQIHGLRLSEDASLGHMTWRQTGTSQIEALSGLQNATVIDGNSTTISEEPLEFLRYYNPSSPATLVVADGKTGTYSKKVLFESITSKLTFRANYQNDVDLTVYLCKPKDDTSQDLVQAWTAGLLDQSYDTAGVPSPITIASPTTYPSDFALVKELWSLKRVASKRLLPGQQCTVSHSEKNMVYNPAVADTHALTYQKHYKAFQWLIVVKGTLVHDTVQDETTIGKTAVDVLHEKTFKLQYNAGINLTYVVIDDNYDTITNAALQSQKPTSDNMAYSRT